MRRVVPGYNDERCRSCRRRKCGDIGLCVWIVVLMYIITLAMLFLTTCITFFCGKDAWFAKGGVVATYILVGFFAGNCRKRCIGIRKWMPILLYMGIWYVIMLGTGKNGFKDFVQLAIITVIIVLSFVWGSIFHKYSSNQ